jgi:hypothetical protein
MSRWHLILILIAVLCSLAIKFLPWYVTLGLVVLFVLSFKFLGGKIVHWLFMLPFRAKGAILHNATVVVHSLEPTDAPPPREMDAGDEDEEGEEDEEEVKEDAVPEGPRDYFRLDVTITPQPSKGPYQTWEIGDLMLVAPDYEPMSDDGDECRVEGVEVESNGQFHPDEGYKLPGPQRLRLLLAVKPGTKKLVFHYYLETFGEVVFPAKKVGPRDVSHTS